MINSISFILRTPKHGWLPVDFYYMGLHLDLSASDGLNNPIEELFDAVTELHDNEVRRTTWWLEPGAFFIDFEKKGQDFTLTIFETEDLHNESAEIKQLIKITGTEQVIIHPFRSALKQFSSLIYEKNHWSYMLDKNKLMNL